MSCCRIFLSDRKEKVGKLILEVKREFDSKGTEKENHCQSEKQFT